jgi:hypothetical protein
MEGGNVFIYYSVKNPEDYKVDGYIWNEIRRIKTNS